MKIKILSIICLVFSVSSCNKWLDVDLANKVDEGKLFKTEQGFQEALAGVYSQMSKTNLYGGALTYEYLDIYAQYYSQPSSSSGYEWHGKYDYKNATVKSAHASIWQGLYNCIAGVNNIISWTDKNAGVFANENNRNRVRGEAIAIRAFLHFDLYRMFCKDFKFNPKSEGIPYNKIFGVSLPQMYTVEEVLQLILNDLLEAEELMATDPIVNTVPYQIVSSNKNDADKFVARMNLYAIKAMIARVHQARGDGKNAVKYAKEVIESGKFRLLDFKSVNQDEAQTDGLFSDEHIFSLRNKDLADITHKIFYKIETTGSTTPPKLSFSDVYNKYEGNAEDQRYAKWFNNSEIKKYELKNSDMFFPKIPIIKLSEMYLIVAECSYASNPEVSLEYMNTLRDHRIVNNRHWSYLTIKYIYEEMVREYLGEGQLWYVYKRNNLPLKDALTGSDIPGSDLYYVFPMPDKEIENGHRTQN